MKVLVSVHSRKIMGLGPFGPSSPLFFGIGQILGLSPIREIHYFVTLFNWTFDRQLKSDIEIKGLSNLYHHCTKVKTLSQSLNNTDSEVNTGNNTKHISAGNYVLDTKCAYGAFFSRLKSLFKIIASLTC